MNSRPTPETDAALYPMNGVDIVWPDFARRLERERDEARKVASGLAEQAKRLRKKRDEAREEVDYYREKHDLTPMSWNV